MSKLSSTGVSVRRVNSAFVVTWYVPANNPWGRKSYEARFNHPARAMARVDELNREGHRPLDSATRVSLEKYRATI